MSVSFEIEPFTLPYFKGPFQEKYNTESQKRGCAFDEPGVVYETVRSKRSENRTCNYNSGREFAELYQDAIDAEATEITFFGPNTMPAEILGGKLRRTKCTALMYDNGTGIASERWKYYLNDGSTEIPDDGRGNNIGHNKKGRNANLGEKCFTTVTISKHVDDISQINVGIEMHTPMTLNTCIRFMRIQGEDGQMAWRCCDKDTKHEEWTPLVMEDFVELIDTYFKGGQCGRLPTGTLILMFGVTPFSEENMKKWCKNLFFDNIGNIPRFIFNLTHKGDFKKGVTTPYMRLNDFEIVKEFIYEPFYTNGKIYKSQHNGRKNYRMKILYNHPTCNKFVTLLVKDKREKAKQPDGETIQFFCANQHIPVDDKYLLTNVFTDQNRKNHWIYHFLNEKLLITKQWTYRIIILLQDCREEDHKNHIELLVFPKNAFRIGEDDQREFVMLFINSALYLFKDEFKQLPTFKTVNSMYNKKQTTLGGITDEECGTVATKRSVSPVLTHAPKKKKKTEEENQRKNFVKKQKDTAMDNYDNKCYNQNCRIPLNMYNPPQHDHMNGNNADNSDINDGPICARCHQVKTKFEVKYFGNNRKRKDKGLQNQLQNALQQNCKEWRNAGREALRSLFTADTQMYLPAVKDEMLRILEDNITHLKKSLKDARL